MKKSLRKAEPKPSSKSNKTNDEIRFYRANEKPYGPFSNLYKCPAEFEGRIYPTAEHAYQAGKAAKPAVREWILAAPSPSLAAMAAHGLYTWDVVPNWSKIKFDRMRGVLLAKFTQHPQLRALLIETNDKRLVEVGTVNNAVNRLWGEVNGVGQNMLGQMLMELRSRFLAEAHDQTSAPSRRTASKRGRKSNRSRKVLQSTQLCDFRSFAHGRHLWLTERSSDAALLVLTEPSTDLLWRDMESQIPLTVPRFSLSLVSASTRGRPPRADLRKRINARRDVFTAVSDRDVRVTNIRARC